jgi:hypothetical protein
MKIFKFNFITNSSKGYHSKNNHINNFENYNYHAISNHFLKSIILIVMFSLFSMNNLFSQSEENRKEYYKNMLAKGETSIKTFNTVKKSVQDKILDYDIDSSITEFRSAYLLFSANYFNKLKILTSEFDQLNNFYNVPEMDYLITMNTIQEKKIKILNEGIKFFEEISSEITTKPMKRWDVKVIDNFVDNSTSLIDFGMYKRLRPVCYDIVLLNECRNNITYLKCTYNDWAFMAYKGFPNLSKNNPLLNYNMVNHKLAVNHDNSGEDSAENRNKLTIDINNSNFDYSEISYSNDSESANFSSWLGYPKSWEMPAEVQDVSKDDKGFYSNQMANSKNALALVFFIKSLDFEKATLNNLLKKYNLQIKNCTYDKSKNEFNYDMFEEQFVFDLFNNDIHVQNLKKDKDLIHLLNTIIPQKSPLFYSDSKPITYVTSIENFDKDYYQIFQIKKDLVLTSAYFRSIYNDLKIYNLNVNLFKDWFNKSLEKNNMKAYYQNEYMLKLGKTTSDIWTKDRLYLASILTTLRATKYKIKENHNNFFENYQKITTLDELYKLFETNNINNFENELDDSIIENNTTEIGMKYYLNKKNFMSLSYLGRRCLYNNQLDAAENLFKECLKLSPEDIETTINLAHVYLFSGEHKKAMKLYLKYPMNQVILESGLIPKPDVKTTIERNFNRFIKLGKDPKIIEDIKKELKL